MLIASLVEIVSPAGQTIYCATDPIDGEVLTRWHDTIMQVDAELEELDVHWGLMLACHRGESDVPTLPSDEDARITEGCVIPSGCTALPCH